MTIHRNFAPFLFGLASRMTAHWGTQSITKGVAYNKKPGAQRRIDDSAHMGAVAHQGTTNPGHNKPRRTNPDGLRFPLATSGGEMGMPSHRVPREFHAKGGQRSGGRGREMECRPSQSCLSKRRSRSSISYGGRCDRRRLAIWLCRGVDASVGQFKQSMTYRLGLPRNGRLCWCGRLVINWSYEEPIPAGTSSHDVVRRLH